MNMAEDICCSTMNKSRQKQDFIEEMEIIMELEMSKDIKCIPITNKKQIAEWRLNNCIVHLYRMRCKEIDYYITEYDGI